MTMAQKPQGKLRKDFDVRKFWPWYERTWHTTEAPAESPPFTLDDLGRDELPVRAPTSLKIVAIVAAVFVLTFIVWGVFFA